LTVIADDADEIIEKLPRTLMNTGDDSEPGTNFRDPASGPEIDPMTTDREAVATSERPREEPKIATRKKRLKTRAQLSNRQEGSEADREPFTRNNGLCTPFKDFLDKAIMGQKHKIPRQHPAL
jgi:hypothetical protein